MHFDFALIAVSLALLAAAAKLGGGLYECFLVDRLWPSHPWLIQPQRGGLNRKTFWMPAHITFELAIVTALWAGWDVDEARPWLILAAASHLVMRLWSLAYFIPRALELEQADELGPDLRVKARDWVKWSAWRLPLDLLSLVATYVASLSLAGS